MIMLSILIPLRDEYENLAKIENLFAKELLNLEYEVILINDYSQDNTLAKANDMASRNPKFISLNNKKKGLGGAISFGVKKSRGKFICIMMADFSDSIIDLKKYYHLIKEKNLDAVFTNKFQFAFLKFARCSLFSIFLILALMFALVVVWIA